MNAYVNKEDYFDKYFQMDTILIIFFYKYIILVLNSEDNERHRHLRRTDRSSPNCKRGILMPALAANSDVYSILTIDFAIFSNCVNFKLIRLSTHQGD